VVWWGLVPPVPAAAATIIVEAVLLPLLSMARLGTETFVCR
jgi:hypothetical protein